MIGEKRSLGETGIKVGRIGISSSYGAGPEVYEEALTHGCNYFTWGTFIKGRSADFITFVRQIVASGRREDLVIGLLSYTHTVTLGEMFLNSALRKLGTDYVDCLILGYYSSKPPDRILEWGNRLKERGIVRAIGLTTHNRDIVVSLAEEQLLDFFHFRYNAVHRGAERDIFPLLPLSRPGLISFTATCWGKLLREKKMLPGMKPLSAGDCYRFVLERDEVDVCMMGVRDLKMFHENMAVLKKGAMSYDELEGAIAIGDHLYQKRKFF
jgi:predicted aldo/keto reductase-like oxidoreductase